MLKLAGGLIVITASAGFAYCIRKDMTEHLRLLYGIRRLFVTLSCEAACSLQPVEILLGCFVRPDHEGLAGACREIADRLIEKQRSEGEAVWQEVFSEREKELGLTGEEAEIVKHAGIAFFGKSVEENKKQLTLTLERLDFVIEATRGEQKEKQRVYQALSVVCGLMLIILLI